jgi:hypothetical protein
MVPRPRRHLDLNILGRNNYDAIFACLRALEALDATPRLDTEMAKQEYRRQDLEFQRKREAKGIRAAEKPYSRPLGDTHIRHRLPDAHTSSHLAEVSSIHSLRIPG